MNTRDRLEALRRVPEYQADFKEWRRLVEQVNKQNKKTIDEDLEALKAYETQIKRRWKVKTPLPPPLGVQYDGWDERRPRRLPMPIFTDELGVNVLHPNNSALQKTICKVVEGYDPFWYDLDYKKTRTSLDGKKKLKPIPKPVDPEKTKKYPVARILLSESKKRHRGGKHLCMTVDLTRTKDDLVKEFEGLITHYKKAMVQRRNKEATLDHWKIYDMVHIEGLTLNQAAQKEYGWTPTNGKAARPFDEPRYKAYYEMIARAYERALKMIKDLKK